MELETERLLIRSLVPDDVPEFLTIVRDPEVMRYLGGPMDLERAHGYVPDCIERDRATGISRYAVVRAEDELFVGFCGFKALHGEDDGGQVPAGESWIDMGWSYRPSAWRQGYGTEAARAIYRHGKETLDLRNIEIRTHRDNAGSLKIIQRLGRFEWLNDYESPAGVFKRFREL
jgi:ribosomal-protein-alanine N-acetyltransferase